MAFSCPLSFQKIDAKAVRLSSWFLLALLALSPFSLSPLFLLFLEFFMRVFYKTPPLLLLAKNILTFLKIEPSMEDGGAKKFAASLGLFTIVLLIVAKFGHMQTLFGSLFVILFLCIALEALFGYCIGCKLYTFYLKGKNLCRR